MNPVYDTAYYEDLAGRLYGLVIRLDDRLSGDQAQWLHHVTEVGEYGLALDDMTAILAHGKIAITDRERRDLPGPGRTDDIRGRRRPPGSPVLPAGNNARSTARTAVMQRGPGYARSRRAYRAGRGFRRCSQDAAARSRQVQADCRSAPADVSTRLRAATGE